MSTERPAVTVLVPTFNRAEFIAECLDSLLSQTLPASQILVVNDGSTDDTVSVLAPYRSRIDYLETPQLGKPGALNRGLEKVTGKYLWIFDDDDVALPDALERFVKPLEAHPEHGFSFSPFYYTASRPDHRLGEVMHELPVPDLKERGFLVPLLESNFLGGAALFARASCYAATGPFDPELLRSQDYDMAVRIAHRFTGVRAEGGPTFHYRQHEGLRGNARDRFRSGLKALKWLEYDQKIFRKIYRELSLAEYLPPGAPLEAKKRLALLQRIAVMANKLLVEEAVSDLRALAAHADTSPFSEEERRIVRTMIESPYYEKGNLLDRKEFLNEIRVLCKSSEPARLLRREVLSMLRRRCVQRPGPRRAAGALRRVFYLCRP